MALSQWVVRIQKGKSFTHSKSDICIVRSTTGRSSQRPQLTTHWDSRSLPLDNEETAMTTHASGSVEAELAKERTFGGDGIDVHRDIRIIDLADPTASQSDIDDALWSAAAETGFFHVVGHGITQSEIDAAFDASARFLARKLGFRGDFFTERHDPTSPEYQSTLRIFHYLPMAAADLAPGEWRAGAHTDYDCLTLLHQREGQHGLQLCPGAEAADRDPEAPLGWTDIEPASGTVTCHIGDMLMRWSDDQLPSTLHRVRMPRADEVDGEQLDARYSIAYFAQADRDALIESPSGKHAPITAADYLQQRIAANFAG
jgi:isopenicillin N synthase-like dioxygenase